MIAAPKIESVKPAAALPGGEIFIKGSGFGTRNQRAPACNSARPKAAW